MNCREAATKAVSFLNVCTPNSQLLQGGSYGKVVSHVIIGLKTVKGAKQLKLDPTIYDSMQKEKVCFII